MLIRNVTLLEQMYGSTEEDGAPIIEIPPQTAPVAIVSVGLPSLQHHRVMAS